MLGEARHLGFLGPGPLAGHLANALGFAAVVGSVRGVVDGDENAPASVLDLGSGGGLPGLVLGSCWPVTRITLVDANERRTDFLDRAVRTLGVGDRLTVQRGRAEEVGRRPEQRGAYDLVVARSFGPPATTAECAAPFLRVGGLLVVSEPPPPHVAEGAPLLPTGGRWPADGLARLGMAPVQPEPHAVTIEVVTVKAVTIEATSEEPEADEATFHFQVIRQQTECPEQYPRRVGVPAKRPLF
ncbi:MAG TPA: RsmG family class I SAM-dependent methyltransferase [Acidimicrobiales bacterium]|nr:RsmG family class I SAM-dependent methyltransferase [Acidimicrobiales bacterium]